MIEGKSKQPLCEITPYTKNILCITLENGVMDLSKLGQKIQAGGMVHFTPSPLVTLKQEIYHIRRCWGLENDEDTIKKFLSEIAPHSSNTRKHFSYFL